MRPKYAQNLIDTLKIKSLTPDVSSSVIHTFECLLCGNIFDAMPKDKVSKFKKHNKAGCPTCARNERFALNTERTLSKIYDMGFELMESYKGVDTPILVRKYGCCGRAWESRPHNIIQKNPSCKPCRDDKRSEKLIAEQLRQKYIGRMKLDYLEWLKSEVKLKVLEPIKTSNDHHDIQCVICDSIFNATPKAKVQQFKQNGRLGCPVCTSTDRYRLSVEYNKIKLANLGFSLLEEYTSSTADMLMANLNCCSRPFTARTNNVLSGKTICPPCNDERKRAMLKDFNQERHETALKHMEGFQRYTKLVRVLTEQTYRDHHETINPNNLSRKRSGQDGYHLDHIYSIYRCYHDGVPEDVCAHPENLQMLEWKVNAVKYNKVDHIPSVVKVFISV